MTIKKALILAKRAEVGCELTANDVVNFLDYLLTLEEKIYELEIENKRLLELSNLFDGLENK